MSNVLAENGANSKPICHGSPRPLLELASMKVALTIWVTKFDEFYPSMNASQRIHELHFSTELSIVVPQIIQNMIDATLPSILWELQRWAGYIKDVQNNLTKHQIYTRFSLVAFGGNGTVNFKASVANFLEDDSLDNMTRFEIACINCIEEKVDHFWPLVSCNLSIDNLQFDDDFMLYYWICRKRGELDRIPLGEFNSIEHLMMDKCCMKFMYLALEYFFTSFNPNDQLVELEKLLNPDLHRPILQNELQKYGEQGCFTHLFPNIDGPMQRLILDKYTTRILYAFASCLKPAEYVIRCFIYLRDIITPERYLRRVVLGIMNHCKGLSLGYHQFCGMSQEEERYFYKHIEMTLEQIWIHTLPHLKEFTLEHISSLMPIYRLYDNRGKRGFGQDIRFLLRILSEANAETRNRFWNEFKFTILGVPPSQIEELVELCFMSTEAIEEFKRTFPQSRLFQFYCSMVIHQGSSTQLDVFLNTLYSNKDQVLDIKKHLLQMNPNVDDSIRNALLENTSEI